MLRDDDDDDDDDVRHRGKATLFLFGHSFIFGALVDVNYRRQIKKSRFFF